MVFLERLFGLLSKQEIFFEDRFELGERLYDVPLAVPNDEEFFPFGNVLPHRCRDHDLGSRRIVSMKRRNPQIKIKQKNIYVIWQTILTG